MDKKAQKMFMPKTSKEKTSPQEAQESVNLFMDFKHGKKCRSLS